MGINRALLVEPSTILGGYGFAATALGLAKASKRVSNATMALGYVVGERFSRVPETRQWCHDKKVEYWDKTRYRLWKEMTVITGLLMTGSISWAASYYLKPGEMAHITLVADIPRATEELRRKTLNVVSHFETESHKLVDQMETRGTEMIAQLTVEGDKIASQLVDEVGRIQEVITQANSEHILPTIEQSAARMRHAAEAGHSVYDATFKGPLQIARDAPIPAIAGATGAFAAIAGWNTLRLTLWVVRTFLIIPMAWTLNRCRRMPIPR